MEAIVDIFAVTIVAAVVFAVFVYAAYVAFLVLKGTGERFVEQRRHSQALRMQSDPYTAALKNIQRLEKELGDKK